MLVDLQVTLAGELEREPAVLGQLLDHVIEEADSGVSLERGAGIEVDPHVDVRLLRAPLDSGASRGQVLHHCGPCLFARSMAAHAQPAHAEVGCELEIRVAVADHGARAELDPAVAHMLLDQSGAGLTAGAAVRLPGRADKNRIEIGALGAESGPDELLP